MENWSNFGIDVLNNGFSDSKVSGVIGAGPLFEEKGPPHCITPIVLKTSFLPFDLLDMWNAQNYVLWEFSIRPEVDIYPVLLVSYKYYLTHYQNKM